MGAWSAEPFGNDTAADFAWELDEAPSWAIIADAFADAAAEGDDVDIDTACIAIAAAEVVAHGLGQPTQSDGYTESVDAFVARVGAPESALVDEAVRIVTVLASSGELAQEWAESDPDEWREATSRLLAALAR